MATATAEPALEEGGGPATAAPAPAAPRTHCCSACSFPVAAYGRLVPCRHAFCLACATGHALCFLCQSSIARVERVEGPLWLSTVTLEAFDSAAELEAHLSTARSRLAPIRVLLPPSYAPPTSGPLPQYAPMAMRRPPAPLPPGAPPVPALPGPAGVPGVGGAAYRGGGGFAPPPHQPGP